MRWPLLFSEGVCAGYCNPLRAALFNFPLHLICSTLPAEKSKSRFKIALCASKWDERNMRASKTNWDRVAVMRDDDIDFSETPEVTAEQMARARLRVGGRPVPKGKVRVNVLKGWWG